jgi:glycine/D-amino acid oxidase-like deaminating enzyme
MSPTAVERVATDPDLPKSADVVVIGGGIIGCAAAYCLAGRGIRVALVEKGRIGAEQSSRNWGWCRTQGRDLAELPLMLESMRLWDGLAEELAFDVGFRRTGVLFVTKDRSELDRWDRWRREAASFGAEAQLIPSHEVAELIPGAAERWLGGLYTASDGCAEPARAAPAFAAAARRGGATMHEHCAARALDTQSGTVRGVITEKGTIRAATVLCAGGIWSSLFCRRHGIPLPQLSVRASVQRTTPATHRIALPVASPGICMRLDDDGGYILAMAGRGTFDITPDALRHLVAFWPTFRARGRKLDIRLGRPFLDALRRGNRWATDRPSPFELARICAPDPDQALLSEARADLARTVPALAGLECADAWGAMIDVTPDALPVISPVPALKGLYLATGFSGHGFGLAPSAARLASDLITGATPIADPHPFRYSRLVDGTRRAPNNHI